MISSQLIQTVQELTHSDKIYLIQVLVSFLAQAETTETTSRPSRRFFLPRVVSPRC